MCCGPGLTGNYVQSKEPEEHSATGSASELHGGAQQAGWPGPKENGVGLPNGIREKVQPRPAASEKGQSPAPSRQLSTSFSLQSSLSEPMPGQLGSGQDGPAAPNPSGRSKGSAAVSAEVELQRDSASQVELAARAVEAREMEKERLRCRAHPTCTIASLKWPSAEACHAVISFCHTADGDVCPVMSIAHIACHQNILMLLTEQHCS